jgi:hypothetical protein
VGEDGTKLGSLELLSAHLLAVGKLFPGSQEDISYSLVELLLQTLLSRPDSPPLHASVFRLLLELSRKQPLFTPVVALGANAVFQLVPLLDITAAAAFGRWFASHLINTQLSWPAQFWDFWVGELAEAEQVNIFIFRIHSVYSYIFSILYNLPNITYILFILI